MDEKVKKKEKLCLLISFTCVNVCVNLLIVACKEILHGWKIFVIK